MTEPIQMQLTAQIAWGDVDSVPVLSASHFAVQTALADPQNPTDLVLTIGYLPPPMVLGTPEQQRDAMAAIKVVTVRPVARFSMPKSQAGALADAIRGILQLGSGDQPQ